jgi:hypothetical protein
VRDWGICELGEVGEVVELSFSFFFSFSFFVVVTNLSG